MTTIREFEQSPQAIGRNEVVGFTHTTTWGSSPSSVSNALYDITEGRLEDVSASKLTGSPSVAGNVITTSQVTGLEPGHVYRLELRFTVGGNTFEPFLIINGEA